MPKYQLPPETIEKIEATLNKGAVVEVKIEHGKAVVIAIKRKKVEN